MRTVSCLALACLIGSAMPAHCQTPPNTDKIKIEVTRADLQLIGQGLMELPYKSAVPLLSALQMQLNAADAATQAERVKADKAKPEEKPADKPAE